MKQIFNLKKWKSILTNPFKTRSLKINNLCAFLLMFGLFSCSLNDSSGYENEEVLMKYISTKEEFSSFESFNIVTVKSRIYCANCMPVLKISDVINYIQTINNEKHKNNRIFIVTDGELPNEITKEFLDNKNIQIIVEKSSEMQRYGIYHTHIHWFSIKRNTITDWNCFMTNDDLVKE